ncbi:MAG: sugar phosphate nucleotidyltransferase [Candidatus Omnitrophota bacterium]|jgi:mannose-1-phosphate guanylyltransferase
MKYAIILAGGTGSRFWPLSRHALPKQFLNLYSDRPMIEQTIKRIQPFVKKSNIYIATNKIYRRNINDYLKNLHIPPQNLLFEPESRNTLAPIGLLAKNIYDKDKEAVILVLPSDHYIENRTGFLNALTKAVNVAKEGYIVTFGIIPDRLETGYGYIKIKAQSSRPKAYKVDSFIEKPPLSQAQGFIRKKGYYWNSGIFIFRPNVILQEIKKFAPRDYRLIIKSDNKKIIAKVWPRFTSVSIDYAIMEKTNKLMLIPGDFGWMDLGSWQAVEFFGKKDKCGNIFKGNCIDVGSKNVLVWSDKRLLATVGLENMIIADTKDALLVCAKNKAQDVKKIVQILREKKSYKQI